MGQEAITTIRKDYCEKSKTITLSDEYKNINSKDVIISLMAITQMPGIQDKVDSLTTKNKDKFDVSETELEFSIHKKLIKVMNKNCDDYSALLLRELGSKPLKNGTLKIAAKNVDSLLKTTQIKSEISLYRVLRRSLIDSYYESPTKIINYESQADFLEEAKVYLSYEFKKFLIAYAIHMQLQQLYTIYDFEMPGSFGISHFDVNITLD